MGIWVWEAGTEKWGSLAEGAVPVGQGRVGDHGAPRLPCSHVGFSVRAFRRQCLCANGVEPWGVQHGHGAGAQTLAGALRSSNPICHGRSSSQPPPPQGDATGDTISAAGAVAERARLRRLQPETTAKPGCSLGPCPGESPGLAHPLPFAPCLRTWQAATDTLGAAGTRRSVPWTRLPVLEGRPRPPPDPAALWVLAHGARLAQSP